MATDTCRDFDGTDDSIRLGVVGNCTYGSIVALMRKARNDDDVYLGMYENGGSESMIPFWDGDGNLNLFLDGIGAEGGTAVINNDEWYIVGLSKASGSATPRGHYYRVATTTWTHENFSGAMGNWQDVTGGQYRISGDAHGGQPAQMTVHAAAVMPNVAMSDGDYESLAAGGQSWLDMFGAAGHLWVLNQTSVATPVSDATGNGADEVSIVGTAVSAFTTPIVVDDTVSGGGSILPLVSAGMRAMSGMVDMRG